MSAIYTLNDGQSVTIGGTSSTGPFPKYSLSRSTTKTGDKTKIGNRYSITLSGTIIADSDSDITVSGEMQSDLHLKIINKLQVAIQNKKNVGRLEIVPYGGQPNALDFRDAELVDITIPEQPDDSSGILYSPYTFVFEATEDISNSLASVFDQNLESAEESWSLSVDEESTTYTNPTEKPHRTYTITHTVSASGLKKFDDTGFKRSGWKEAANWVNSRLVTTPASTIILDAVGDDEFTEFNPEIFDNTDQANSTDLQNLNYYNHVRVPNSDLTNGGYSITETWKASKLPATLDMEISTSVDGNEVVTITLSGTISGLDITSLNNTEINKLTNAETVFEDVDADAWTICNTYYNDIGTLQNVVRSKSVSRNKGTGIITFSYSFDDTPILIDNAISTSLKISDDNEGHTMTIIAEIGIIGKDNGPEIQNMNTSRSQKRSVNLMAVMRKAYRTVKPPQGKVVALSYVPNGAIVQGIVEDWEPLTGVYSINVDWTY